MSEMETRCGLGYDAHRFAEPVSGAPEADTHVMVCGVAVPHICGVLAHSDGDVGLHALVDALLGAIGAGDIGQHFPPTDARWQGADSAQFVAHALELVRQRGGRVVNADLTIIAERPKIGPHREAMRQRVAALLAITPERVNIKATTTEGMGFTGRREGLAAQAVVSVLVPALLPQ